MLHKNQENNLQNNNQDNELVGGGRRLIITSFLLKDLKIDNHLNNNSFNALMIRIFGYDKYYYDNRAHS